MKPFFVTAAVASALAFAACGDDTETFDGEKSAISFGTLGSLSQPAGKGSFRFGAASAATQIEDQNTATDWYLFTQPTDAGGLGKGTFVGEASKGYTLSTEDVFLLRELGVDSYRFSIEWARIEPQRNQIDMDALAHYSAFVDALLAAGIRPLVTLHHFSNPVWIDDPRDPDCAMGPNDQNLCGLGHPVGGEMVIAEMAEHAKLIAETFGNRVDEWGTLNEPINYLLAAYGVGSFPPGKRWVLSEDNLRNKFVPVVRDYLRAHAAMYQAIKSADAVDADGDGRSADVGLSLSVADWTAARNNAPSEDPVDVAARDAVVYVYHHLFVDAIREGKFDPDIDGTLDQDLPEVKGTIDWLGVQYYFRAGVTGSPGLLPVLGVTPCFSTFDFGACLPPIGGPSHCVPTMKYEYHEPGLHDVLVDFSKRWPDLPLLVSESGIATETEGRRSEHVVRSLEQIARAQADGADVRGYYHWSLYDNFEWAEGFVPRFGLYQVDYGTYARTPTDGATTFSGIITSRSLTPEMRKKYGGEGAMTPETGQTFGTHCSN